MTTGEQIINVLKDEPSFGGVFLYNQLSKIPLHHLHKKAIIINYVTLEESEQGHTGHWVVLDNRPIPKANDNWTGLYFFDSYGLPPDEAREIMKLPNTHEIEKLIHKLNVSWKWNSKDWQVLAPWDSLCGVYSVAFVMQPSFNKNPTFNEHANRTLVDEKLTKLFINLGFVK